MVKYHPTERSIGIEEGCLSSAQHDSIESFDLAEPGFGLQEVEREGGGK